jgi:hypothetical protein
MWIGLLHHVCNTHEWLGGKCKHPEGDHDESLPWFDRRDKDFVDLQKVILNPELLDSLGIDSKIYCIKSIFTYLKMPLVTACFMCEESSAHDYSEMQTYCSGFWG